MSTQTYSTRLYFVVHMKCDAITHPVAGPFVDYEAADEALIKVVKSAGPGSRGFGIASTVQELQIELLGPSVTPAATGDPQS